MKKIICYLDNDNMVYQNEEATWSLGIIETSGAISITHYEENSDKPKVDVLEFVKAGMSAEDIIKLKHGGVI